jgi:hypothetical protein
MQQFWLRFRKRNRSSQPAASAVRRGDRPDPIEGLWRGAPNSGRMARVTDAVQRFRQASQANDVAGMTETLAHDAELVSPLSGHMVFRGARDLELLLTAVYGSFTQLRWTEEFGDRSRRLVLGEARIGPLRLGDAMVIELDDQGQIRRIRPHLRPWLAVTVFAIKLGPKVLRNPGVVWRALRSS